MKSNILKITPELATYLLLFNEGNRKTSASRVNEFVEHIQNNTFMLTNQGIGIQGTISNPIKLLDGQHRLIAIKKANVSVEMLVCTEEDEKAYKYIDAGRIKDAKTRHNINGYLAKAVGTALELTGKTSNSILFDTFVETLGIANELIAKVHPPKTGCAKCRLAFMLRWIETGEHSLYSSFANCDQFKLTKSLIYLNKRFNRENLNKFEKFSVLVSALKNPNNQVQIPDNAMGYSKEYIYKTLKITIL